MDLYYFSDNESRVGTGLVVMTQLPDGREGLHYCCCKKGIQGPTCWVLVTVKSCSFVVCSHRHSSCLVSGFLFNTGSGSPFLCSYWIISCLSRHDCTHSPFPLTLFGVNSSHSLFRRFHKTTFISFKKFPCTVSQNWNKIITTNFIKNSSHTKTF